jgi:hypothetical protein
MNRYPVVLTMLLVACMPVSTDTSAQARGPSATQIQESGQRIESRMKLRRQEWEKEWGTQARESKRAEMHRDPALRAATIAGMQTFLRRLTGRFRIAGKIERHMAIGVLTGDSSIPFITVPGTRTGDVTGIADCGAVGKGAGVNCIISASWPVIDKTVTPKNCNKYPDDPVCVFLDPPQTAGEQLDTMRPAVLVLGLNADQPEIRAMLVTADTLANEWAGPLNGDIAKLLQTAPCTSMLCYERLNIVAEPGGSVVSIVLQQTFFWSVTITLSMHRDPEAQLQKKLKPMKAR